MNPTIEDLQQHFKMCHPVDDNISQYFGENKVDFYATLGMKGHNGIDYGCPIGTMIYAPCRMQITNFYYESKTAGYGTTVRAMTEPFEVRGIMYRLELVFGHLSDFINIHKGLWVEQGEPIAISGNTGKYTTGAHLHFGGRICKKSFWGGWKVLDPDNGYKGYMNLAKILSWELNMMAFENNLVHGAGSRYYFVQGGKPHWVENELDLACLGMLFEDALQINPNLLNQTQGEVYRIDYNSHKTKEVKQLVGLLKDNSARANKLYNLRF